MTGPVVLGRTSCSRSPGSAAAVLVATRSAWFAARWSSWPSIPSRSRSTCIGFSCGSCGSSAPGSTADDFERAVELLAAGAILADGLITHIAPLSATAEAFAALESGRR